MSTPFRPVNRRQFLIQTSALAGASAIPSLALPQNERFSRDIVLNAASALASMPFLPLAPVPDALLNLNYDEYRRIQYRKEAAVWGGTRSKFNLELFAPGSVYNTGIEIDLIENGEIVDIPITNESFRASTPEIEQLLASVQRVAGFRIHYPLNTNEYKDEFVVFQGASYFRAVSKGQNYGLSARGLAIDVAEPTGEEFPIFRRFWIERPSSRADEIVVHALLDSPRVAGAYRFGIFPDEPTRLDIEATLFARSQLDHVGLGALTSMFLFGGMDKPDVPDYRDAVHDSNGLAMLTGNGEYLWRPLTNPTTLQISAFADNNPRGFGLAQRFRELEDYQDLQANYHKRPSAWVTPRGDWGAGQVVLVEIPTPSEANDNIVAYWRPQEPLIPGAPFSFAYQLTWPDDSPLPEATGRVMHSSYGLKLATQFPQIVVDYMGLPDGVVTEELTFDTGFSSGTLVELQVDPNGANGARLYLTFDPAGAQLSEIRVQPRYRGEVLGETLLFRWLES